MGGWAMWCSALVVLALVFGALCDVEEKVRQFIQEAETRLQKEATESTFAAWDYESNINDDTQARSLEAQEKYDLLFKELGKKAITFKLEDISDPDLMRKMKMLRDIGTAALDPDKLRKFNKLKADMSKAYSTAKVKDFKDRSKSLALEPELTLIMAQSRDPEQLRYYWQEWREVSGKKIKGMFGDLVKHYNEAALLNGYKDASLMKVVPYESDTFIQEMEDTWQGLKPLYQELHAYVRTKLNKFYGDKVVPPSGPLPAHLLGNMWAQSWGNIGDLLKPYPEKPSINVTGEMVAQLWTPMKMFQKADEFFQSIGLDAMPDEFWTGSILEKPEDGRDLTCHASAWDFYNGKDFRIKQCTRVNQEDLVTVNHEMGHIQYYLQYKNLTYLYRSGANPGFHEGVADIISLAVGTATYFQRLGLIYDDVDVADEETNINLLLNMALERIAFLPFGYLVDKFRWDVYAGRTSFENMNCHWWKLRHEIQGMAPPGKRTKDQFDAGAKYHVAGDVGYVRYFTAYIYEFQFYRAMCLASGKYVPNDPKKPLHQCNFYGSREAGDKLREMLKLGASRPWKEAMEVMTGEKEMSTNALREYFQPLETWLKKENAKNGAKADWGQVNVDAICGDAPATTSPSPAASGATVAPPGSRIGIRKGEFPPDSSAPGTTLFGLLMPALISLLLVWQ